MSENLLQLIPQQPAFVPSKESQSLAKQFLESQVAKSSEVYSEVSEHVRFVDAGANFKSISCPLCEREIPSTWWSAAMDEAHGSQFSNLDIVVPCCRSRTTLNHLNYNFPQGFARFVLTAKNPDILEMNKHAKDELERLVGCELRVIWSHY